MIREFGECLPVWAYCVAVFTQIYIYICICEKMQLHALKFQSKVFSEG